MKRHMVYALIFGAAMAVLWGIVFYQVLKSAAAIAMGLALGVSFTLLGRVMFAGLDKNSDQDADDESGQKK